MLVSGLQGAIELGDRLLQLVAMAFVRGDLRHLRAKLGNDVSKQTVVDVDVNRFAYVLRAWMFEHEQYAGRIHRSIETG